MPDLKIGQVARAAGVAVDTIRYYERLGLLPSAPRRSSGYRMFEPVAVDRVKLIKHLQDLGLSLQEVDAMLGATGELATCEHESVQLRAALERTEQKLAALATVRDKLRAALTRCTSGRCTLAAEVASVQHGAGRPVRSHSRSRNLR